MCVCRLLQASFVSVVEQSTNPKAACEALGRWLFSTEELRSSSVTGFRCARITSPGQQSAWGGGSSGEWVLLGVISSSCFHTLSVKDAREFELSPTLIRITASRGNIRTMGSGKNGIVLCARKSPGGSIFLYISFFSRLFIWQLFTLWMLSTWMCLFSGLVWANFIATTSRSSVRKDLNIPLKTVHALALKTEKNLSWYSIMSEPFIFKFEKNILPSSQCLPAASPEIWQVTHRTKHIRSWCSSYRLGVKMSGSCTAQDAILPLKWFYYFWWGSRRNLKYRSWDRGFACHSFWTLLGV